VVLCKTIHENFDKNNYNDKISFNLTIMIAWKTWLDDNHNKISGPYDTNSSEKRVIDAPQ